MAVHRHNMCRQSRTETFQIELADMPQSCAWVYQTGEERYDQTHLSGTYIARFNRHGAAGDEEG